MELLILFLLVLKLHSIGCNSACNTIKKCGECIGNPYDRCVWCEQEDMNKGLPRCESKSNLNPKVPWCESKFIIDPVSLPTVTKDAKDWTVDGVQFRPIEMKIKMRPGVPVTIPVSYKPAKDHPLDVYFLIDNSDTMQDHKTELKKQAYAIYNQLIQFTNNVQFGVGTFIEKPAFPFYDSNAKYRSYSYEHHLSFTTEIKLFSNVMDNTPAGANYDDPEAGLDALMQVMACNITLGWRPKSRRFIVLFTDSTYHSAGDGKVIGIAEPNDMKCHLKNNQDAMSLQLDYPSVSQIRKMAYEGGFKIIFAAPSTVRSVYQALALNIESASYTELQSDIVKLIVDQYTTAVNTVKLNAVVPPRSSISVKFDQDCNEKPMRNCESTFDKPKVDINVTIEVKSCQKPAIQNVVIGPTGLTDKLTIQVEIECECDCEKKFIDPANTSPLCNDGGVIQCGICKCNTNRYGSDCKCFGNSTVMQDIEKCKENVNETKYCNGNGDCQCGTCQCNPGDNEYNGFYGDFCQFNNDYCPGSGKDKCSGNGICKFNECHCNPGFINTKENKDCSCAVNNDLCRAPYSKEICSGYGLCECGKCICNKISPDKNETYLGKYCDSSVEYKEKRCKELGVYAQCIFEHNQHYCDTKSTEVYDAEVIMVNKTEYNAPFDSGSTPISCKHMLDDGSFLYFKYYYEPKENNKLKMRIQNEPEFPPKANIYIAAGSAICAVLLIGIATLIGWKILVDLHDKREFIKFSDEATAAGYNVENPLYQKPTYNVINPAWKSSENI